MWTTGTTVRVFGAVLITGVFAGAIAVTVPRNDRPAPLLAALCTPEGGSCAISPDCCPGTTCSPGLICVADAVSSEIAPSGSSSSEAASSVVASSLASSVASSSSSSSSVPTVSGTVYTDEGTTHIGAGTPVRLVVDGTTSQLTVTDGNGAFSFSLSYSAGAILLAHIDGASEDGVTVTRGNTGDVTGFNIYQDRLIVRHEDASALTSADINTGNDGGSDITAIVSDGASPTVAAGKELFVWPGKTYAPGTALDINGSLDIRGTLNLAANAATLAQDLSNAGTLTCTAGTDFTLDGTAAQSVNFGSLSIGCDIIVSNTSAAVSLSGNGLDIGTNDLTVASNAIFALSGQNLTADVESNAGTVRLRGSETVTLGTKDTDSGIWEYVGDGDGASDTYTVKDFGTTDYYTLRIASADSGDTYGNAASKAVAGLLTVTNGTFNANGQTVTATGLATVSGGTYTASTATQTFNGGLTVSGGTFTGSSGTVDVNGVFTLSSGTFTAPSGTMTLSGNFTRSGGTFTHNSGTVTFDGANQTISGSNAFHSFSKTGGGGQTITFTSGTTQTVAGTLTLKGTNAGSLLTVAATSGGSAGIINSTSGTYGMTNTNAFLSVTDSALQENGTAKSPEFFAAGLGDSTNGGGNTGWFAASCGNNVIEGAEVCDGTAFASSQDTCQEWSAAYTGGSLQCINCASVSVQYCAPQCGNAAVEAGEGCDDGNTANGDGCSATCEPEPRGVDGGGSGGNGYITTRFPPPPPTPMGMRASCCHQSNGSWEYPVYYDEDGIHNGWGSAACVGKRDVLVFVDLEEFEEENEPVPQEIISMCKLVDGYCCRPTGCYDPVNISNGNVCGGEGDVLWFNSSPTIQMTNVNGQRVSCPAWPTCQVQCGNRKEVVDPQCAALLQEQQQQRQQGQGLRL